MINFNEKYNRGTFSNFLKDFLPDYTEKEKDITQVDKCKMITEAKELGYSESLDVYVLEMTHDRDTDPRVTIATDAFRILANYSVNKALVIFKNNGTENYRFSYLTISLDLDEKNNAVRPRYSNARRYSFYLGVGAKIKTPEQQLIKEGRITDTEDLLSRFSLEVVNKQFYLEIAKLFDELIQEDKQNLVLPFGSDQNIYKNFAMRLIGRIMFCWFLKQKKSPSGQLIPDELLSSKAVQDNYYHTVLELLFFATLNTQIKDRKISSDAYDKVPYLNGSLFNPQDDDYYKLDHGTGISRHINILSISDTWFKDFFTLLETYNFTIDENTVFDQELSVDPEMLGHIFENLLAKINPETGSSERKQTGSYYTPRQIVDYMVDQSLVEYLKTKTSIAEDKIKALVTYDLNDDIEHPLEENEKPEVIKAIDSLKVLDPACGSGAFPIGMMQKIVWVLRRVDENCDIWLKQRLSEVPDLFRKKINDYFQENPPEYIRKIEVIKNSIFGVDIQPIAVEISRLRCFLTLVVESEVDDSKLNRNIEPLPNLDFKFVCANTLISLPKSDSNGLFEDSSGIEELSAIMSEYFIANQTEKALIKDNFQNKQKKIFSKSLSSFGKNAGNLTIKLSLWNPFENKSSSWFDPEWMFGIKEKFNIVIGNPPYLRVQGIDRSVSETYKDEFVSATGSYDLYVLFVERSINLITQNGVVNFIIPHKWINSMFGKGLRNLVQDKISRLISFKSYQVFNASTYTSIVWFSTKSEELRYLELNKNLEDNDALSRYFSSITEEKYTIIKNKTLSKEVAWALNDHDITHILHKLNAQPHKIVDTFARVYQGIATGKDGVFFLFDCLDKDNLIECYSNTLNKRIMIEKDSVKPLLKGSDVHRYEKLPLNKVVIFPYEKMIDSKNETHNLLPESLLASKYPNTYNYLKECENCLRFREKGRFDIDGQWYQFSRKQGLNGVEQEKIVGPEISLGCNFSYDQTGSFYSTTKVYGYILKHEYIDMYKFFLAILNSKILWFFVKNTGYTLRGGYFTFKTNYLNSFPLPKPTKKMTGCIEPIVKDILKQKKCGVDITSLEKQVDELVFDIYNLTEKEKEIIRKS